MPSMSKSFTGVRLSMEKSGTSFCRICSIMSGQGVNTLSHQVSSRRFSVWYSILMPRLLMPISYTSGNISAYLT